MTKNYRNNRSSSNRGRENSGGSRSLVWIVVGLALGLGGAGFLYSQVQPNAASKLLSQRPSPAKYESAAPKTNIAAAATAAPASHKPQFDFYTMLSNEQAQLNPSGTEPPSTPPKSAAPAVAPTEPAPAASAPTPALAQNKNAQVDQDSTKDAAPIEAPPKKLPPVISSVAHEDTLAQEAQEALNAVKKSNKPRAEESTEPAITQNNTPSGPYFLQVATISDEQEADHMKAELLLMGLNVNVQKSLVNGQTLNRIQLGPYSNRKSALRQQALLQRHKVSSILVKG